MSQVVITHKLIKAQGAHWVITAYEWMGDGHTPWCYTHTRQHGRQRGHKPSTLDQSYTDSRRPVGTSCLKGPTRRKSSMLHTPANSPHRTALPPHTLHTRRSAGCGRNSGVQTQNAHTHTCKMHPTSTHRHAKCITSKYRAQAVTQAAGVCRVLYQSLTPS